MHKDHGAAALELFEEGAESRGPEVDAFRVRVNDDPASVQLVERMREFLERSVHVGEPEAGEESEPAGALLAEFGGVFVEPTGHRPRLRAVAGLHARSRHRKDGRLDAVRVHRSKLASGLHCGIGKPAASTPLSRHSP